jgi:hypothetical protein
MLVKSRFDQIPAHPETPLHNLKSGAEVAQSGTAVPLPKHSVKQSNAKRSLSRSHADYWKSRLFQRSYKHEGTQHQVFIYQVRWVANIELHLSVYHVCLCCFNSYMSIINLTPTQLRKAADLQDKIAQLQSELTAIFGSESKAAPQAAKPAKKKGGMSAAGRAKVAAAQKARWAKINAAKAKTAPKAAKVKQAVRKMSAEGRAKIAAAAKARWAKVRAEKAKQ